MPTNDQYQELINGTNHTWTTINGVSGQKITSKTDSTKYIFFPAGGYWQNTYYYDNDKRGNYWTATFKYFALNQYFSLCFHIYYGTTNINVEDKAGYHGLSVRAIQLSKSKFSKVKSQMNKLLQIIVVLIKLILTLCLFSFFVAAWYVGVIILIIVYIICVILNKRFHF